MKTSTRLALFVVAVLFAAVEMRAQEGAVRPRVVTPGALEKQSPALPTVPQAKPADLNPSLPSVEMDAQKKVSGPITHLTPSLIQTRISEAQRMFKTRPKPTAMAVGQIDFVTIAALDRLMQNRTTVLTSHRPSLINQADWVYVIEDGRVTEQGRPSELAANGGWFSRFMRSAEEVAGAALETSSD